jgi:hypothetical protein
MVELSYNQPLTLGTTMAKRIDSLVPGTEVKLHFHGSKSFGNEPHTLDATFVSVVGEGDAREANFLLNGDSEFAAYRYGGRWAYGSSAEKLSLV